MFKWNYNIIKMVFILFACYKDDYELDIFVFIAVCTSVENCYNLLKTIRILFKEDMVFIGNRDNYKGTQPYLIQEAPMNYII